jgi:hypothetical protein
MSNTLHLIKNEAPTEREHLRAAIEAVEAAEIAHAKAIEAHERARTMLSAAEADVKSFVHLDGTVAAHHAGKLKAAIASGEAAPDLSQLPAELADKRAKRDQAFEKLDAIKGPCGRTSGGLADECEES